MGKWLGVAQRTAWKMGHAIRQLMEPGPEVQPPLSGIVELDEKYFGGKPRHKVGVRYKRGQGTKKQGVLVAVERHGPVRSALIESNKTTELLPLIEGFVQKEAQLMTDENHAYQKIGRQYASHEWVKHSMEEFARGDVHNNTAESFNSLLERAKQGVFHYMSQKHLPRYLNEIGFRWDHRMPKEIVIKNRARKIIMVALPVIDTLRSLLTQAVGKQLRRTRAGGIRHPIYKFAKA
jgi:transposase-like protein